MKQSSKNKRNLIIWILILLVLIGILWLVATKVFHKNYDKLDSESLKTKNINVVPTMQDKITQNSAWCGTFQLVWNDMMNELVGQNVKFEKQLEIVDHLNLQAFQEDDISQEDYYKKFGLKTIDLKNEIERNIQEKFNEKADVLNDIDWSEEALNQEDNKENRYLFYAMLKKEFSYPRPFTKLENGDFATKFQNVRYFGIDNSTEEEVRNQVDVLYYSSETDCAVALNTEGNDQVILVKGSTQKTFDKIYEECMEKTNEYQGQVAFGKKDFLKVPEMNFKVKREYKELQNKPFYTIKGETAEIAEAIQLIEMKLDEKGGSLKSEAVMDVMLKSAMPNVEEEQPRYFEFDEEYVVFLQENGKEKPYFAATIADITKFQ